MPPQHSAGVLRSPSTPPPRFFAAPHLEPEPSNQRLRPQSSKTRRRHTKANGRRSWWKGLLAASYTTQSPFCKSSLPHRQKNSSSGTGPERALDRSNKSPKARQRDSPSSRAIPASAGPVPRSHPHETHTTKIPPSTNRSPSKPHQHPDTQAAAEQGRNEHWIVATNPPKRVSAIAPPPERSLRVQDLSRGATPTRRTQPKSLPPPTGPQANPTNIPTPKQQRNRAGTSIGS